MIRLLSLDLLHFLRSCFDDFYDLVNAIVVRTNWEAQVEKLVQIIREDRRNREQSETSPESGLGSSLPKRAVGDESESSPQKISKPAKKTALDRSAVPEQSEQSKDGVK